MSLNDIAVIFFVPNVDKWYCFFNAIPFWDCICFHRNLFACKFMAIDYMEPISGYRKVVFCKYDSNGQYGISHGDVLTLVATFVDNGSVTRFTSPTRLCRWRITLFGIFGLVEFYLYINVIDTINSILFQLIFI